MSKSFNKISDKSFCEFERQLASSQPTLPPSLRSDVEASVERKLRQQMFHDDIRWLAICLGILFMVVAGHWLLLQSTGGQLQELSRVAIASTDDGRRMVSAFARSTLVPPGQLETRNKHTH